MIGQLCFLIELFLNFFLAVFFLIGKLLFLFLDDFFLFFFSLGLLWKLSFFFTSASPQLDWQISKLVKEGVFMQMLKFFINFLEDKFFLEVVVYSLFFNIYCQNPLNIISFFKIKAQQTPPFQKYFNLNSQIIFNFSPLISFL